MRVHITNWALDAYLTLKGKGLFSSEAYRSRLRPDALRLASWPTDPTFDNGKFWGSAFDSKGKRIDGGYKMKWHNFGNGNVQLRMCVAIVDGDAYLCHAYVKTSDAQDKREMAKLKSRIAQIRRGTVNIVGELT